MNLSAGTATNFSSPQTMLHVDAGQVQALLVFYLGERTYGLFVEHVVQVIPMLKLTPMPQVKQVIEGVANVHGKVVPVLSARRCLGLPLLPPRLHTPIILVQVGDRVLGLIVDRVADVIHVPCSQITQPGAILAGGLESAAFLSGFVYQGDQAVIVIDPRCLLYPSQMRAVNRAIQSILSAAGGPAAIDNTAAGSNGKVSQNGQSKPRRKRRMLEATLAGEMASLAADLPPSDGRPVDPSDNAPAPTEPQPPSAG